MARNTKAKKKKGIKQKISFTRVEYEMELKKHTRKVIDGMCALLEYNMIIDNHLSPDEAERQSRLMDSRADAIIRGDLTWEEVYKFLEEYHAKAKVKQCE